MLVLVSTTHGLPISKLTPFDSSGYDHIIEYVADMVPKESGSHYFGTYGIGPTQTFVNDNLIYEQTSHTADPTGFIFDLQTEGVASYTLQVQRIVYGFELCLLRRFLSLRANVTLSMR
jgi:hypothetical protein